MWAPEENSVTDRLSSSPMLGSGVVCGGMAPECVPDPLRATLWACLGLRLPTYTVGTPPPPLGRARLQQDTIKALCLARDFCSVFLVNEHVSCGPRPPAGAQRAGPFRSRGTPRVPGEPATLPPLPLPTAPRRHTHLWPLVQEGVPYFEEDVTDDAVHKQHEKPVEGDEGVVHVVLLQVRVQSRQLLTHEVSKHALVHLGGAGGKAHCAQ